MKYSCILATLLCIFCTHFSLSQETFFAVGSKKNRIAVVNAWAAEVGAYMQSQDFRSSGEYMVIQEKRLNSIYIAFSNDLFKKYFGKTYAELSTNELVDITDVLYMRGRGISELRVDHMLREPFMTEKAFKKLNPPYLKFVPNERALTTIKEINKEGIFRPQKGKPTVTGKELVTVECLGLKLMEAMYENRVKGLLVTEVRWGGAGFLAGIQPDDLLLDVKKPGVTDADRFLGASDYLGFQAFLGSGYFNCNGSQNISFSMLYKNPDSAGYLPFTGNLLLAPSQYAGEWVSAVKEPVKLGYATWVSTARNQYGELEARERKVRALNHGYFVWPNRLQFKGIDGAMNQVADTYKKDLDDLKAKVSQLPCLFDDASVTFKAIKQAAVKIDQSYTMATGSSGRNTLEEMYRLIAVKCRSQWWFFESSNMTAVVRSILNEDQAAWKNHLVEDNWGRWVRALFMQNQHQYRRSCSNANTEPMDTVTIKTQAVPDVVFRDKWGIERMRSQGREANTYYYTIREKYAEVYVSFFNELNAGGIFTLTTADVSAQNAAEYYLSWLYNKHDCHSKEIKTFEEKLWNAVLFIR